MKAGERFRIIFPRPHNWVPSSLLEGPWHTNLKEFDIPFGCVVPDLRHSSCKMIVWLILKTLWFADKMTEPRFVAESTWVSWNLLFDRLSLSAIIHPSTYGRVLQRFDQDPMLRWQGLGSLRWSHPDPKLHDIVAMLAVWSHAPNHESFQSRGGPWSCANELQPVRSP